MRRPNLLYRTQRRAAPSAGACGKELPMSKAITILVACLMAVQIIRPLGLPGLKRRKDAWKLAVLGFALILAAIVLRPS